MSIGAAAKKLGLTPESIRTYERAGLVRLERDSTGRRLFTDEVIAKLARIRDERRSRMAAGLRRARAEEQTS
jgi:DNA-binding transcriptional MerR regulator